MKNANETKRWMRNASDELAVANGCWFDESKGQFVVDWIERYCRLYEGEWAGQPITLWRDSWSYEVTMRLFGWQKQSIRWRRAVRRFRQASVWTPKKQGKSPVLAAWGLYLLAGDAEPGQKVYFGASDGAQAREISGKHAIEMVMASESLSAECTINKSLMQITHDESRSILKPISSVDSRAQKSKEGLNGCILIDETHVVDEAFMGRVSRAGISRSEPLQIEVSTAGDNPESYGRQRYEYGKSVESGVMPDETLLFACWEAPQDLSDEALSADPVKYGRMANPAWGHTIGEEEYLADYRASTSSLTNFLRFKMYRLNIWQSAANPWLDMTDWAKCQREYSEDDLKGQQCYAGLDMALTRDTTALVLLFPEEDNTYRQLAYFWLPKDRAVALRDRVRYEEWSAAGHIYLTDGSQTDFSFIPEKIGELLLKFNILKLGYDKTYAEPTMQRLVQSGAMQIEQQAAVPQTMMHLTAATVHYENLLHENRLHHNGNSVLTWQAGNAKVKSDNNENIRPIKQKPGDYRTIDGVIAGVMALGLAMQIPEQVPWGIVV